MAALFLLSAAAGNAPRAVTPSARLTVRYARVVAGYDSIVFKESRDSAWHWLDAVEAAAPADTALRIVTGVQRALLHVMAGQYDAARRAAAPAHERSLATRDTLLECRALYVNAISAALEGRPAAARPDAERLLRLATAARLRLDRAQARLALAYLDLLESRPAAAERGYRAALRDYPPETAPLPRRIARIGLARACFQQGRHAEARQVDIELIAEARAAGDAVNESYALNNLAVHEMTGGEPTDAVACLRRAYMLQRANHRREAATTGTNLAHALVALGRHEESVAVLDSLLDGAAGPVSPAQRVSLLTQLATVRTAQGRMASADALVDRAWALADSAGLRRDRDLVCARAQRLARAGDVESALRLLDRSLTGERPEQWTDEDDRITDATAAEILGDSGRPAEALPRWRRITAALDTSGAAGRARYAHALLGESRTRLRMGDVTGARATFRLAVAAWERTGEAARAPRWSAAYDLMSPRSWGEGACAFLRPVPGEPPGGGARAAFDLLQRVRHGPGAGPAFAGGTSRAPTATHLQARALRPGELALDFYPARESLLVFALTCGTVRARTLPEAGSVADRVARFADLAHDRAAASAGLRDEAARLLSAELLAPFTDLLAASHVLFVSGGGLMDGLPWALLPEPGGTRALDDRHTVAVVPSLAAIAATRAHASATVPAPPLVLAGSRAEDGGKLPGVEREVSWLKSRYERTDVRSPRSAAELRSAIAALANAGVVHVAAHFTDDPENPWRSGVLLGDPRRDDGWLRTSELAAARTRARLAVLAGCTSAGAHGRGLQGERGLASAFLAAGAPAVVGTLWPVDDAASAEFVRRFYTALDSGADAGGALAAAQAGMRAAAPGGPAADWAAFVLVGDPSVRVALERRKSPALPAFLGAEVHR